MAHCDKCGAEHGKDVIGLVCGGDDPNCKGTVIAREITHHPHCDGGSCDCADYPINALEGTSGAEMRPEYDLSGGERGKYVDRYQNAKLEDAGLE